MIRTRPSPSRLVLASLLCLVAPALQADYTADFSSAPYTSNQTVLHRDGWDHRLPTSEDRSDTARVVPVRWNRYRSALVLKGANLKNAIPPTTSPKVTIAFDLAVTFPDSGPKGKQFRLGFIGAPCGEIFMDIGPDGGLGYQANGSGQGGIVSLGKSDTKLNAFYTFVVTIDYSRMTYDIAITGTKRDDSPFHYEAKAIPFDSKTKSVSGIYILSGSAMTAYLGSVSIESK
jgi:hypothetical protein